jgi:hypothetical protein
MKELAQGEVALVGCRSVPVGATKMIVECQSSVELRNSEELRSSQVGGFHTLHKTFRKKPALATARPFNRAARPYTRAYSEPLPTHSSASRHRGAELSLWGLN